MLKTGNYGAQLLGAVLRKPKSGISLQPLKGTGKAMYYSLPSRDQFREFFVRKRRLFWIPFELEQIDELA